MIPLVDAFVSKNYSGFYQNTSMASRKRTESDIAQIPPKRNKLNNIKIKKKYKLLSEEVLGKQGIYYTPGVVTNFMTTGEMEVSFDTDRSVPYVFDLSNENDNVVINTALNICSVEVGSTVLARIGKR